MRAWLVLISLLLHAMFAPQISLGCGCASATVPVPLTSPTDSDDEACVCCAGSCECGMTARDPSTPTKKSNLDLPRVGEQLPACPVSHQSGDLALSRCSGLRECAASVCTRNSGSASERRAVLCLWQI